MRTRWSTTTKATVVLVTVALVALLLARAHTVVTAFAWAAVFAYVFTPVVDALQSRTRAPRLAVVATLYVILGLGLYLLGRALVPAAVGQVEELRATLPKLVENVELGMLDLVEGTGLESVAATIVDQADQLTQSMSDQLVPVALGLARGVLQFLLFAIALWYFLLDGRRFGGVLRALLPAAHRDELLRLGSRINAVLGQYVRGQVILIAIMWAATGIGLSLLNVPFSIVLGFVTGVLETIPIAGPITAGALAVLVAFGHQNPFGWSQLVYAGVVAAMYTALRNVEDYFVVPQVIGRIVELHPLVVIFSLLAGGAVAGLLGIVLAVPIAASVRIGARFALAKLRDEDPYPSLAEPAAAPERAAGVKERTA